MEKTRTDISSGKLRKEVFALVSSAENSSTDYAEQYAYIEDIGDGRGYTAGIIGFTTGTGDLLEVVERYTELKPENELKKYISALEQVNGTDSHDGLGKPFEKAWVDAALEKEKAPSAGGDETVFLTAFLDARVPVMQMETAHSDLSRLNVQRKFLSEKNFNLALPLEWTMYGETFSLTYDQISEMP